MAFEPGPNSGWATADADQLTGAGNNEVEVIAERTLHYPAENYEPPRCPACGAPIEPDDHWPLAEEWLSGAEPTVACAACHATNRIGDWVGDFTFYVGNLAVRFNNWTSLTPEFTSDLGEQLGARWRVVNEHF